MFAPNPNGQVHTSGKDAVSRVPRNFILSSWLELRIRELGWSSGRERTRTPYLLSANEALYQVSYAPK